MNCFIGCISFPIFAINSSLNKDRKMTATITYTVILGVIFVGRKAFKMVGYQETHEE